MGKLDTCTQLGWFVGYDLESKGYRIYWPGKRTVSVKHNVVFNENNIQASDGTVSISGGILSEGEKESEKVIQYPKNCVEIFKKTEIELNTANQPKNKPSDESQDSNMSSSIPFPSVANQTNAKEENTSEDDPQQWDL